MNENEAASTRTGTPDEGDWLPVPQATARLGISEKTLRRRIKAGALESQKTPKTDGGGTVLRVRVNGVPVTAVNAPDSVPVTFKIETDSVPVNNSGVPVNSGSVTGTRAGHEMDSAPVTSESDARVLAAENQMLREALQRERETGDQWRAQCEAANRDAAEMRAALRKALEAMPKQIEAREYSQADNGAQNAQEAPKSSAAAIVSGAQKNTAQSAPRREARPLWKVILGIR